MEPSRAKRASAAKTRDVDIYCHTDISDFLVAILSSIKSRNPQYSVRAWAKQLGYKNPSLLLDVLHRRRRVNTELRDRIAESLCLGEREREYFNTLGMVSRMKSEKERAILLEQLDQLRPDRSRTELKNAHFKFVQDWYCLVILEMTGLPDFRCDPSYIACRLRYKVSPQQVELAITNLKKLGLLVEHADASVGRAEGNPVLRDEVPSEAVRNHHRQMMIQAREALRELPIEERDFRSTKFAIRKNDIPAAKEIVKGFHKAMQKLSLKETAADEIYAFNTQLFSLTGEVR
jgi:uncharacterized protein (TIGR02147 family)